MMRSVPAARLVVLLGDWRAEHGLARRPLAERLGAGLRALVLDGRLPVGVRLPAERDLATALGVSRGVAAAAYDGLRDAGLLQRRVGAGSFTALPEDAVVPAGGWGPRIGGEGDVVDLTMATMAAPVGAVLEATRWAADALPAQLGGTGYDLLGLLELRVAVAERYAAAGVPTTPDQVLITTGGQAAVDLVARTLLAPGDAALLESPAYPNAIDALRTARARLQPVPVDQEEGWDAGLLVDALRRGPRLAYLVPDFQNPTGCVMPAETRQRVLDMARRAGSLLVVDEALIDVALEGERPDHTAALASGAAGGSLLTIGSLSKPVWGGLRVGWVRADPTLVRRIADVRAASDMGPPVLGQLVAVHLLRILDDVLAERRTVLRAQRDALVAALAAHLPEWRVRPPRGGMSLWISLDVPASTALAAAAPDRGLRLAAGPRFGLDGSFDRFLRLPFTHPEPVLVDAVERLAALWPAVAGRGTAGTPPRVLV
ncbi:GntR family transcriptional regulator [Motilibacter rhizosphaerae]|uniref:GntR family transcriptional regulator n=1 Tax=Motilibacter rhizosphaerae TaxID=598652 RepID=A0A4Q7NVY1_9ACTN|nr:PLP-dependent aminotransferase family protein [Motilibacter rhizosphaerae]RZS91357.1 GntR family transcriptional regulator [Motilibacter rhizosphaerae]